MVCVAAPMRAWSCGLGKNLALSVQPVPAESCRSTDLSGVESKLVPKRELVDSRMVVKSEDIFGVEPIDG